MLPAQAGVIPKSLWVIRISKNAPRAGGGDPEPGVDTGVQFRCSPRRRG